MRMMQPFGSDPHRQPNTRARALRLVATPVLGTLVALMVTACATTPAGSAHPQATLINFVEHRGDSAPYHTRFVVTPAFMRVDSGPGSRDFILLNRKQHKIYRVDSSDRSIMIIGPKRVKVKPPFALKLSEKDLGPMKGAPMIDGRRPLHYQFSARGKLCFDVVAVPGLMNDALAAMREFRQILADESTTTFNLTPPGMQSACDMARSTFAPTRHLAPGFPIEQRRAGGHTRSLVNFNRHFKPKPGLFKLPKGYQTYTIQQFRKGAVNIGK